MSPAYWVVCERNGLLIAKRISGRCRLMCHYELAWHRNKLRYTFWKSWLADSLPPPVKMPIPLSQGHGQTCAVSSTKRQLDPADNRLLPLSSQRSLLLQWKVQVG